MLEKEGPDSPLLDLSDVAVKELIRGAKKRGYVLLSYGSVSALHTKFLLNHLFYVENSRGASERCFSVVRHSLQRTLPIAEAF